MEPSFAAQSVLSPNGFIGFMDSQQIQWKTGHNGPPRLWICHQRAVHKREAMPGHCNLKQNMCLCTALWWQIKRRGGPLTGSRTCHKQILEQRSYATLKLSTLVKTSHLTLNNQSECVISAQHSSYTFLKFVYDIGSRVKLICKCKILQKWIITFRM